MHNDPVEIRRILRPMRGSSQSQLVEGEDGKFYVAKFVGNPEGNRTLINEWLARYFFQRLQIATPALRILHLGKSLQAASSALCFNVSGRITTVEPGLHLGSQCPVNPETTAIFDFVPRKLLTNVANLADLGRALLIDKLLGHIDARQAVFTRDPKTGKSAYRAYLIDHGRMFGGCEWVIRDWPRTGLYFDKSVYSLLDMPALCSETMKLAAGIGEDELYSAIEFIPQEWFADGDAAELASLFLQIKQRQKGLDTYVLGLLEALAKGVGSKSGSVPSQGNQIAELPSDLCFLPATC